MNRLVLAVALVFLSFGAALALWTHHEMQSRLKAETLQQVGSEKSELYPAAMKSELEIARLSALLAAARSERSETTLRELNLALDVAFSRHFLHSNGALFRGLMRTREYSTMAHQIDRLLSTLEFQIKSEAWNAAWRTQGDLAIAMNEITRLSLNEQQRRQDAAARELDRFRQQCQTLNLMAWLMMAIGALVLGAGQLARVRVSQEREYELV